MNKINNDNLVFYGKYTCLHALQNPERECIVLYATQNALDEIKPELAKIKKPFSMKIVDRAYLDRLVGDDKTHQGVALMVKKLKEYNIYQLLEIINLKEKSIIVCLDQVVDPHNVGSILRNAVAFGADAVIVTKHHSPQEGATIAKTACGALDLIPLITVTNLVQTMELMKKNNFWCYGLSLNHPHKQLINETQFANKSMLILGAEHNGLRKLTNDKIDSAIYIPMQGIDSLNVSSSSAIALFYLSQQICK